MTKLWRFPKKAILSSSKGATVQSFQERPRIMVLQSIAKVKPGREDAIRQYGKTIEQAVNGTPNVLAPLRLHYLRWVLFDIGPGLHFMYQGIFDTDFDKYVEVTGHPACRPSAAWVLWVSPH
jgi:hypothetical protein